MRIPFLIHLLDSVAALARPRRIVILGSSSLLPQYPELGEAGHPLEVSLDADLLLDPVNEAIADMLKDAVGEESGFQQQHGYYADILRPAIVETLPAGWESRLHPVTGNHTVFALDPYDLALVKLVVGRAKDLELLRAMLRLGIVEPNRLRHHHQQTPLGEREAATATTSWGNTAKHHLRPYERSPSGIGCPVGGEEPLKPKPGKPDPRYLLVFSFGRVNPYKMPIPSEEILSRGAKASESFLDWKRYSQTFIKTKPLDFQLGVKAVTIKHANNTLKQQVTNAHS
jgi:hypothetical protein